jgi:hypothetical protein
MEPDASRGCDGPREPSRRDFLELGARFPVLLACAGLCGTLAGCARQAPAGAFEFLRAADVELFGALTPAVIADLQRLPAGDRDVLVAEVVRRIDASCGALGAASQADLRRLLDLLSLAPLRWLLTGVAAWARADVGTLQRFLARWRESRFAILNAGAAALVKLVAVSYYLTAAGAQAAGYPGPLARLYRAANP